MGAGNRIEINFIKFIGIGFYLDNHPYDISICISIPFVEIHIGLGKPYTWKA